MGGKARAELKTQANDRDARELLAALPDPLRRRDALALLDLFTDVTGWEPTMWGDRIVGFGRYHYRSASGSEGDWPRTGFAPGKAQMTLYFMPGFAGHESLLAKLGPHKHSVSCLYVRRLDTIDLDVLRQLVVASLARMAERYPLPGDSPLA